MSGLRGFALSSLIRYQLSPVAAQIITKPSRPEDRLAIKSLRAVNILFTRIYHRLEVLSPCPLPRQGPAILVCNHTSSLDPLLIQAPCNRLITWMMAAEYFDIKPLAPIFRTLGVIPVHRSGRDSAATRAALRALHKGAILGVFPEGRIETNGEILPFQTGVALLAIRAGVPVYPAYLEGTQQGKEMVEAFLKRNRIRLRFGPVINLDQSSSSRQALDNTAERIREAVISLKNK